MPSLAECDEMLSRQNRVLDALQRIRDIITAQQRAVEEQRSRAEADKAQRDYTAEPNAGSDKGDSEGGFASGDPKKRRGVRRPVHSV